MSDLAAKNYELAYHISPALDDAGVQKARQEIESIITSHGGRISYSKDPEKIRLSYNIKKQRYGFFGYVQFNSDKPEELLELNHDLKLNGSVMRYLVTKFEYETRDNSADVARKIAMSEKKKLAKVESREKAKKEEVNVEELEKKLEDIIEKL